MKKSSPFYKTGISRSPFNAHEPGHEVEGLPSPTSIPKGLEPKPIKGLEPKPMKQEPQSSAVERVKSRQDRRTNRLLERKAIQEVRKEARHERREIRQNN